MASISRVFFWSAGRAMNQSNETAAKDVDPRISLVEISRRRHRGGRIFHAVTLDMGGQLAHDAECVNARTRGPAARAYSAITGAAGPAEVDVSAANRRGSRGGLPEWRLAIEKMPKNRK